MNDQSTKQFEEARQEQQAEPREIGRASGTISHRRFTRHRKFNRQKRNASNRKAKSSRQRNRG